MNAPFKLLPALAALAAALHAPQASACFTVVDAGNQVVYDAQTAPVDMRFQIHEVLPRVYPGGTMIFGASRDCPVYDQRGLVFVRAAAAPAAPARAVRPDRN